MSRPAKPGLAWRWSRWISRDDEERWQSALTDACPLNWMVVENPARARLLIEAYFATKAQAVALVRQFGGKAERFTPKKPEPPKPVKVDAHLTIIHDEKVRRGPGRLIIPYGMAFGSGEHSTTLMLLRALSRKRDLSDIDLLDLGTGSGVLALAGRMLGCRRAIGTDFDPDAVRTARRNESLNFSTYRVQWEVADVKRLRAASRHELIVANLFSGILVEASVRIARALKPGGELWLSGVLRSQQAEVAAAYCKAGLRALGTAVRGKWVMQQWAKPARR